MLADWPTSKVVSAVGAAGNSTTVSPAGGRRSMVRPWASTPSELARIKMSSARRGGWSALNGGTDKTSADFTPSASVTSSGTSATTPPSMKVRPSISIGG